MPSGRRTSAAKARLGSPLIMPNITVVPIGLSLTSCTSEVIPGTRIARGSWRSMSRFGNVWVSLRRT